MPLTIGDVAPNFTAETTQGSINFHDWIGQDWCLFFSHPKDFTPVCTTELGALARMHGEYVERGVKVIGLSVDPVAAHLLWQDDIEATQGARPQYPLIGDPDLEIAKLYQMLPAGASGGSAARTAMDNATARALFIIGPSKRIMLTLTYPMSTGRDFGEVLRVIDSLQLTASHKVATPANWRAGDDVIILPSLSDDDAKERFPVGWRADRPYLRVVPQPGLAHGEG